MSENFNHENYRQNLARELNKKRQNNSEEAGGLLDEEKQKFEYHLAKNQKHLGSKSEKFKDEFVRKPELDITEKDISFLLPDAVKDYCAVAKVIATKEKLLLRKFGYSDPEDRGIKYNQELQEAGRELNEENKVLHEKFSQKHPEFSIREQDEEISKIIDFLTEGDFYSPNMLNHVVDAYLGNKPPAVYDERFLAYIEPKERRDNNFIHGFDINGRIGDREGSNKLWIANEGNSFVRADSIVIIFDPQVERFRNLLAVGGKERYRKNLDAQVDEKLQKVFADLKEHGKTSGSQISFREFTHWKDVAKWIIDLPSQKAYSIKEKESS